MHACMHAAVLSNSLCLSSTLVACPYLHTSRVFGRLCQSRLHRVAFSMPCTGDEILAGHDYQ